MGNNEVKYVDFGGVLVPENCRRTSIPDENTGKTLYCLFLDDDGTKITYPGQTKKTPTKMEYVKLTAGGSLFGSKSKVHENHISKAEFDSLWEDALSATSCENLNANSVKSYLKSDSNYRHIETSTSTGRKWYYESKVDTTPKIEYSTEGLVFDTKRVKLSNIDGAKYRGSDDEDIVTATNCNNCEFDVSDKNNNMIFNDKVKIINGSGNKVRAGEHDKASFVRYNYTNAKETHLKEYKGEGTHKQ